MLLENGNISVFIDDLTGNVTSVSYPDDKYNMNWVLENSQWGSIDGFAVDKVCKDKDAVKIVCTREKLQVEIERKIDAGGYYETYSVTNTGAGEFFLTKENFGIQFPYQCNYMLGKDILNQTCINHVWCGGDVCWLYSEKPHGKPPYLVIHLTEGAADDYSISYDISRTHNASYYRGAIVINMRERIILPGETAVYKFFYRFSHEKPEKAPLSYSGAVRFSADRYTTFEGEYFNFILETDREYRDVSIYCNDTQIEYKKNGNIYTGRFKFETPGERVITAEFDGRKTRMFVNVIGDIKSLLEKRAHFIVDNQQYCRNGSHIDGAYLIYDNETKSMYCSSEGQFGLYDHNSARERTGMGVLVCKALREKYDEKLMISLKKHREFIEREYFDENTGFVFNELCRNHEWDRIYNFPWLAVYYLEWYKLTGEKKCIENAAKILLKFFEIAKEGAQCIEAAEICECLEKENLTDLSEKVKTAFIKHVDNCLDTDSLYGGECTWCNEFPCNALSYRSQAYILTHDEKYLTLAKESLAMVKSCFAGQPDFHLNCITVRYWDRFWFGKHPSYGDVFPHYWSTLVGWAMSWYGKAVRSTDCAEIINANLTGNLCVYKENGSASNNYLYPYKITFYSSDPEYYDKFIMPGVTYGKNYDAWANDQDWALYYASRFIK